MDNSEKNQDELISTVPSIRIKLCGNFCINYGNKILDVKDISSQLCTLIAFLAVHQGSPCTAEMIISALFSDETRNPQSALKNQVYRCRKFLVEKNIPAAKDLILTMKGGYYLNPHLSIQIDTTEIEYICKLLAVSKVDLSNEEHYFRLLDLYTGDFLSNLSYQDWIDPFSRHYHNLFFTQIYDYLEQLCMNNKYQRLLEIAKQLSFIDKYEERVHYYMIKGLHKIQDSSAAISYYQQISTMFYNDLGVELSEYIRVLYDEIAVSSKINHFNISSLYKELTDNSAIHASPFYCEFGVLKQIFQYQTRVFERTGQPMLLGIITINISTFAKSNKELRIRAITQLLESLQHSLRKGDLYSRCSSNQYVILLSNVVKTTNMTAMKRIEKHFHLNFSSKYVTLTFEMDPVIH
jgi:DNA-binding SARP family transcriptional activator